MNLSSLITSRGQASPDWNGIEFPCSQYLYWGLSFSTGNLRTQTTPKPQQSDLFPQSFLFYLNYLFSCSVSDGYCIVTILKLEGISEYTQNCTIITTYNFKIHINNSNSTFLQTSSLMQAVVYSYLYRFAYFIQLI